MSVTLLLYNDLNGCKCFHAMQFALVALRDATKILFRYSYTIACFWDFLNKDPTQFIRYLALIQRHGAFIAYESLTYITPSL